MSGIFDSFKTGLSTALIFAPKLVLVTLGLVLLNAVAFYLPYLAWQLWFGKKDNDAAAVPKDTDQSPKKEKDDSTPGELQMLENVKAFDVCIICGVIGTVCEGVFILTRMIEHPEVGWTLCVGHIGGQIFGMGLGIGLTALVGGGLVKWILRLAETERRKKMAATEKVEAESKNDGKEKGQQCRANSV